MAAYMRVEYCDKDSQMDLTLTDLPKRPSGNIAFQSRTGVRFVKIARATEEPTASILLLLPATEAKKEMILLKNESRGAYLRPLLDYH